MLTAPSWAEQNISYDDDDDGDGDEADGCADGVHRWSERCVATRALRRRPQLHAVAGTLAILQYLRHASANFSKIPHRSRPLLTEPRLTECAV